MLPVGLTLRGSVFSMHTSREERELAGLFYFELQPFTSHRLGGWGGRCAGDSYTWRWRSSYAYQQIGQPACVFFFRASAVYPSRNGWGGRGGVPASPYSQRRRFWYACQRIAKAIA